MQHSNKSEAKRTLKKTAPPCKVINFEAIGTVWSIQIYQPISNKAFHLLNQDIRQTIEEFDQHYSRFRNDSLVHKMATHAGRYELPSDAKPLLDFYEELYHLTAGAVTPLVGQLLEDAGYDTNYSLHPKTLSSVKQWSEVLDYTYPYLSLKQPAILDFGAIGKGYLVDIVGSLLKQHTVLAFCINAGGDILCQGTEEPLDIGLEHPENSELAIGIASISNQSLCGSSGSKRDWGKYHHIIDPKSRTSPRHIRALWVVADTARISDGLTTALFFVPAEELARHYAFEYAIIKEDYSLEYSARFPGIFYTN